MPVAEIRARRKTAARPSGDEQPFVIEAYLGLVVKLWMF